VSLFDRLDPMTAPRFARWRPQAAVAVSGETVDISDRVKRWISSQDLLISSISSRRRVVVSSSCRAAEP
jgi:hypothetical protein